MKTTGGRAAGPNRTTISGTGSPHKHGFEEDDLPQRSSGRGGDSSGRKKRKQDNQKQDETKNRKPKQPTQTRGEQHKNELPDDNSEPINADRNESDHDHFQSEIPQLRTPPPLTDPRVTLVTPATSVTFGIEDLSSARKKKLTVYGGRLNSLLKIVKMAEDDALANGEAKTSKEWSKFLHNTLDFLVCPDLFLRFTPPF